MRTRVSVLGVLCLLVLNLTSARAASIDCTGAKTKSEQTVCASDHLRRLEEQLTATHIAPASRSQRLAELSNTPLKQVVRHTPGKKGDSQGSYLTMRDSALRKTLEVREPVLEEKWESNIVEQFRDHKGREWKFSSIREIRYHEDCGDVFEMCQSITFTLANLTGDIVQRGQLGDGKFCSDEWKDIPVPLGSQYDVRLMVLSDAPVGILIEYTSGCGNHRTTNLFLISFAGNEPFSRKIEVGETASLMALIWPRNARHPIAVFEGTENCGPVGLTNVRAYDLDDFSTVPLSRIANLKKNPLTWVDLVGGYPFDSYYVHRGPIAYVELMRLALLDRPVDRDLFFVAAKLFKPWNRSKYSDCITSVPTTKSELRVLSRELELQ